MVAVIGAAIGTALGVLCALAARRHLSPPCVLRANLFCGCPRCARRWRRLAKRRVRR